MNIEKTFQEDHQVKLTVTLEADAVENAMERAARKASRNMKIPGFRPGKAPYSVIVKQIGAAELMNVAMDDLVDEIYPKVIEESGIDPFGPGSLTNIQNQTPPVFEFLVPLTPEVTLGEYKTIEKPYSPPELGEKELEEALENLRQSRAILETVDRPAGTGDAVYVNFQGKTTPAEGDPESVLNEPYFQMVLGEQIAGEEKWPYPGFATLFYGLKKGDKGTSEYNYPDNEETDESLRGKNIGFTFEVLDVKSREIPELTDEFAQSLGDFDTLDNLKEQLHKEQKDQTISEYNSRYDEELVDEIIARSQVKYPPQMIEEEVETLMTQLKERLAKQGLDMEIYKKALGKDEHTIHEELHPTAEKRIKRGLVLVNIAKAEEIKVDLESLQAEISEFLEAATANMDKKERRRIVTTDLVNNMMNSAYSDALISKTLLRLRNLASGGTANDEEGPVIAVEEAEAATQPEPDSTDESA